MSHVRWVDVFIDVPQAQGGLASRFWSQALGWPVGVPWANHSEFTSLEPPQGDSYVAVQVVDGPARIHVDLCVDSREEQRDRLVALGATLTRDDDEWPSHPTSPTSHPTSVDLRLAAPRHFGHSGHMGACATFRTRATAITVGSLLGAALFSPAAAISAPARTASAAPHAAKHIATTRWGRHGLTSGRFEHTRYESGVVIGRRPVHTSYNDPYGPSGRLAYSRGRWFSPWVQTRFGAAQLIASYNAFTPRGTFLEVSARGRTAAGRRSSWDSLGRWASHDVRFHRMSLGRQGDDLSRVAVDTLITRRGVRFTSWQLRISLYRRTGSGKTPTVTRVAAVASRLPRSSPTSASRSSSRHDLAVPTYSQQIHTGEYPQWDGGGEAWCSPTSTSMVLGYWNRLPRPRQYAWVNASYRQPWVDYAARNVFAWGYDGAGDWPFNTAYAGRFRLDAFVTRLRSLREAELFIDKGIPLVASISFGPGELDGAPIRSTSGHLLVIRGFTASGKVIVNDPAAPTAATVRRVYRRGQFENAWLDTTGGAVYVIHPPAKRLPHPRAHSNW
jgi:Peptidase_C39 like family/Glyoxalase-like domain